MDKWTLQKQTNVENSFCGCKKDSVTNHKAPDPADIMSTRVSASVRVEREDNGICQSTSYFPHLVIKPQTSSSYDLCVRGINTEKHLLGSGGFQQYGKNRKNLRSPSCPMTLFVWHTGGSLGAGSKSVAPSHCLGYGYITTVLHALGGYIVNGDYCHCFLSD